MTQPYKICPQCQEPDSMDAASCIRCGRVYRTTAPPPIGQTQVVMPPQHIQPWIGAFTLHLSKFQSNPRAVKGAIAAAALLLLTFLSWKAYTTFGGRDVLLFENGYGATGGIPMATQDANDLVLWNRTMGAHGYGGGENAQMFGRPADTGTQDQLEGAHKIVLFGNGTNARLLWGQGEVAHIKITTGIWAGMEGMVSRGNLFRLDPNTLGVKPLDP